jgi:hypothetical protein
VPQSARYLQRLPAPAQSLVANSGIGSAKLSVEAAPDTPLVRGGAYVPNRRKSMFLQVQLGPDTIKLTSATLAKVRTSVPSARNTTLPLQEYRVLSR